MPPIEVDFERAVVFEVGGALAGDLVAFVAAVPVEPDGISCVREIETGFEGAGRDLAMTVGADDKPRRIGEVEIISIPQVGGDDSSAADHLAAHRRFRFPAHGLASDAISFGMRIRL